MDFINWIELAALLVIVAAGIIVWRVCKARLEHHDGFEGIVEERGLRPARRAMDVEEEIERLEQALGKKRSGE